MLADPATVYTTLPEIQAAAAKRVSVVFETSATINHIFYFGQVKTTASPAIQIAKPIIVSNAILTPATKFIEAIQAIK